MTTILLAKLFERFYDTYYQDVMEDEEMKFGPNGGLVFSMEFLLENTEWLQVTFKMLSSLYHLIFYYRLFVCYLN